MNDCLNVEAREALPDLFNGRLSDLDTATMNAHVESCADCRAELALMREARSSAPIAPRMDAAMIASAIRPYPSASAIPAHRQRTSIFGRMGTLRIAAAAVLIAAGGWIVSSTTSDTAAPARQTANATPATTAVPENSPNRAASTPPASPTNPSTVRETEVASLSLVGSTADLSDADLEQLVADLDGMETLPSEEPQAITITDIDIETDNDSTDR